MNTIYIYIYIYIYFDILTKAFKYIIPFFSCDVLQSSFEILILIKILLIFPTQNELKRNNSKTLEGVQHTPSQNKKQIFRRKKRNEVIFALQNRIKSNFC